MIASSYIDLEHNKAVELPQYADSIIFEVKGTGTFSVTLQHSSDGTNWYPVVANPVSSNDIVILDNNIDHIFYNVRAVITGTVSICKVHFRRHKR